MSNTEGAREDQGGGGVMASDRKQYGYCHDCEKSIGVATTDEEAAAMDAKHQNETKTHATSWSDDPVEGVHDG